jgi:hypothetical protein
MCFDGGFILSKDDDGFLDLCRVALWRKLSKVTSCGVRM